MAVFPRRTPDQIVYGTFFVLAGIFFYRIFELNPILNYVPRISVVVGVAFFVYGGFRLLKRKER